MEQEELDLWRIVDVGRYGSSNTIFKMALDIIEEEVQANKKYRQRLWDITKARYGKISTRFQKMDLNLLDDVFPVDILKELKNNVFPKMGEKYDELDSLLTQYISCSSTVKKSALQKIDECQGLVKRMEVLGNEFAQNAGYRRYRETDPNRIYLELD